jgi:hypothetical protein
VLADESDERVLHRLEAFSDIVIGFTLAQIGLSLTFPGSAGALLDRPYQLFAFIITFAIVCAMWWSHHRLFTHFFVPRPLTIVLNFATLGALLFAVYSVQLLVHLQFKDRTAVAIYALSFAVVFGLLGVQYLLGRAARGSALSPELRLVGLRQGVSLVGLSALFVVAGLIVQRFGPNGMNVLAFGAVVYVIVISVMFSRLRKQRQPATSASGRK